MLKVFLVEDERVVRESIRKNIDWQAHGFAFAGEAGDGEVGYSLIQQCRPDIVITDIKMPFMDGLALSRLVRQELPYAKILILTGYSDFTYAQEALRLGATEYLLKPVAGAALTEALVRVRDMVLEEQRQRADLEARRLETQQREQLERQRFFEDLVLGRKSVPQLLQTARQMGLRLAAPAYNVLLLQLFRTKSTHDYDTALPQVQNALQQFCASTGQALLFCTGMEEYALLVKLSGEQEAAAVCSKLAASLHALLQHFEALRCCIAAGAATVRLGDVCKSYETARKALAYQHMLDDGNLLLCDEARQLPGCGQRLNLTALDGSKISRKTIEQFLRSGEADEAPAFVDAWFADIGAEHLQSLLLRQYFVMEAYFAATTFVESMGVEKSRLLERTGSLEQLPESLVSPESTRQHILLLLREALALRSERQQGKYGALLQAAREFIENAAGQEDLSLQMVARAVNLSPTHFSAIFSQETGQTFIEYLTSVRMERARELLRCSNKKTAEIAYEVGYRNPHYFSYLFKKLQGCTPKEFRNGKQAEESAHAYC